MLLTIYKEEDGSISAIKFASQSPEDTQDLLDLSDKYSDKPSEAAEPDSTVEGQ